MSSVVKWCASRCHDNPTDDINDCDTNEQGIRCPVGFVVDTDYDFYKAKSTVGVGCYKRACKKLCDTGSKLLMDDDCYWKYSAIDSQNRLTDDGAISEYCNQPSNQTLIEITNTNKTTPCQNKWLDNPLKNAWKDSIISKNPDVLLGQIQGSKGNNSIDCPLYFSKEYNSHFRAADLSTAQRSSIGQWCVDNMGKIVLDNDLMARVQAFMLNVSNFGVLDAEVAQICSDVNQAKLDMCSCTDNGLNYWLGNAPPEILANPACNYSKCANSGYKNSSQYNLTQNCPSLNICSMNMNIDDIKDKTMVDHLNQQCNMSSNSDTGNSSSQNNTKPDQNNTKPDQNNTKPDQNNTKPDQNNTNSDQNMFVWLFILFIIIIVGALYYKYVIKAKRLPIDN